MELKASSQKSGGLFPADCMSDPEEKEVSDEDDDDRNHKHRRREARSQSLERDSLEPVFTRTYRKRNKPFENGYPYRNNESQASDSWKDFTSKFEKRRSGVVSLPQSLNQRIRSNQSFPGEPGTGRGRGRDSGSWNQRDSRFSSVDIASQMVHQGSLFAARGLPNVSNAQSASWNAFGLISGIPNGGLDALHSIGLQGTLGPAVNSSLNMGIPRPRCRDFEERGFCLRGDMCPMEHGINRIVVEDVQSLSQFNLPVSLPTAQLIGTPAGPGALAAVGAPSATVMNSKGVINKSSKLAMADDGLGFNGAYSGSTSVSGADLYDPDQPLWNNAGPETSSGLLAPHSPKNAETESLMSVDPSDQQNVRLRDSSDSEFPMRNNGTSSSVWGRIGGLKKRSDFKEKSDLGVSSSGCMENEDKDDRNELAIVQGASRHGKRIISDDAGPKTMDLSTKAHNDTVRNIRKPSQKAVRTLFVNGIPQISNKREALLSHFQKFGEVIDIYIPANSERAFVQFARREEAEAALRAPDAVMGNRFIKLWWANRDSIPDDPCSVAAASVPIFPSVANKGKDNLQFAAPKGTAIPDDSTPVTDHPKPVTVNGPKVPPPLQKKLELEQLKEELRKKRELLDQKRNDFRRQLDKLEKQAAGVKGDVVAEPSPKRHKVGMTADVAKATTPRLSVHGSAADPAHVEMVDKNKSVDFVVSPNPKTNEMAEVQESTGLKQPIRPLAPFGSPYSTNRYKLDNRPTTFRIGPPLPAGLANVAALKEYFSSFGDVSSVELEDDEPCDEEGHISETQKNCSARVSFTTRRSAERAYLNGKCWQGTNLQLLWVTSSTSNSDSSGRENSPSAKGPVSEVQPINNLARMDPQEASASGNEEPETPDKNSGVELVQSHEVSQSPPTSISSERELPKCELSRNSMSGEEESSKREVGPTSMSDETVT